MGGGAGLMGRLRFSSGLAFVVIFLWDSSVMALRLDKFGKHGAS